MYTLFTVLAVLKIRKKISLENGQDFQTNICFTNYQMTTDFYYNAKEMTQIFKAT